MSSMSKNNSTEGPICTNQFSKTSKIDLNKVTWGSFEFMKMVALVVSETWESMWAAKMRRKLFEDIKSQ